MNKCKDDASSSRIIPLCAGEAAIDDAPRLTLPDGRNSIPQHYLRYEHSRASVEALIADIVYDAHYPVFVAEDLGGVYIQIGIVGYDNYKAPSKQQKPKIVFGRRWRVEPNLPSSEIIQTVFLAIKKAREHELRELFTLNCGGAVTTPFNNHHDMPLMASQKVSLMQSTEADILNIIEQLAYNGFGFSNFAVEATRLGPAVVSLSYDGTQDFLSSSPIVFMLNTLSVNAILRGLMKALIDLSDAHVDTHFKYRGFARFSSEVDTLAIAKLSRLTRQAPKHIIDGKQKIKAFAGNFESERYETDMTRIPALGDSAYSKQIRDHLARFNLSNFSMVCGAHGV